MYHQLATLLLLPLAVLSSPVLLPRAGDTENDVVNGVCAPVTVIFARGTTETGNVGTLTGPPFFTALKSAVGQVAVQGVDYPADIAGFLAGGDAGGSATMAKLVAQAASQCPTTKIVMSGYSQGGQLVHNAASQVPASAAGQVSSIVIFGDPDNGEAIKAPLNNTPEKTICHTGDDICLHGDLVLEPHLTYSEDAGTAAQFVKSNL